MRKASGTIGACIAVLVAGIPPAAADIGLGRHQQLMTRFGPAEVRDNRIGQPALFVNGQERALRTEGSIALGLPHPDFIVEPENVNWDGGVGAPKRELVWQMIPPFPPADVDPTASVGASSRVIVTDPVARGHVAHQIGAYVTTSLGHGDSVVQHGDWVLGSGCQTVNCSGMVAVWGVKSSDLDVAIFQADRLDGLYGLADDPDAVFAQWMHEHRR